MYITGSEHLLCISTSYIIIQILTYSLFAQFWKIINNRLRHPHSHLLNIISGLFSPLLQTKLIFSPSTWGMLSGGQTKNMAFVKQIYWQRATEHHLCLQHPRGEIPKAVSMSQQRPAPPLPTMHFFAHLRIPFWLFFFFKMSMHDQKHLLVRLFCG